MMFYVKERSKKLTILLVLMLMLCAFLTLAYSVSSHSAVAAGPAVSIPNRPPNISGYGLDHDFGSRQGNVIEKEVVDGENTYYHQFYNFQRGCVYVFIGSDNAAVSSSWQYFGGVRFAAAAGEDAGLDKTTALTRAELTSDATKAKGYYTEVDLGNRIGGDHGQDASIQSILTARGSIRTPQQAREAFSTYYQETLRGSGYIPGVNTRGVDTWDGNIKQSMHHGESTASVVDGNANAGFLIYNARDNLVFTMKNRAATMFNSQSGIRNWMGTDVAFVEDERTVTLSTTTLPSGTNARRIGNSGPSSSQNITLTTDENGIIVQNATGGVLVFLASGNGSSQNSRAWIAGVNHYADTGNFELIRATEFEPQNIPSGFGDQLSESRVSTSNQDHIFLNYQYGAAYVRLAKSDQSQSGGQFWGSRNFPENIETTAAAVIGTSNNALTRNQVRDLATQEVDITANVGATLNSQAQTRIENRLTALGSTKTYAEVQQAFKDYYTANFIGKDNILGVAVTGINTSNNNINGFIMQPFAAGDGLTQISDNVNAVYLVYNAQTHEVHTLKDSLASAFNNLSSSNQNGLGNFEAQRDVTLTQYYNMYDRKVTIQQTDAGLFITNGFFVNYYANHRFEANEGTPDAGVIVGGATQPVDWAVPSWVPSQYGSLGTYDEDGEWTNSSANGRWTDQDTGVVYFQYRYACVMSTPNDGAYLYTYYPGRYFDRFDGYKVKMLSMGQLQLTVQSFTSTGHGYSYGSGENLAWLQQKFYDAFEYWLNQGYFLGYRENNNNLIRSWNAAQAAAQFMYGDSIAHPFNDSRHNICALMLNHYQEERGIYLVTDFGMTVWNDNHGNLGVPRENPKLMDGTESLKLQRFQTSASTANNPFIAYNGRFTAYYMGGVNNAYEEFVASFLANAESSPTHKGDVSEGYISEDGEFELDSLMIPDDVDVSDSPKNKEE